MREIGLILLSVLLGAIGQVSMKWGTLHVTTVKTDVLGMLWRYFTSPMVLLGLFFYGISAVVWLFAVSKVPLSYAYPMVSLGYVVVFVASYFIFGETLSLLRVAGLATICVGVFLISRS